MFNAIKRAFGFADKTYTDFDDTEPKSSGVVTPGNESTLSADANVELADEFLDAILSVLNANLPPLVYEAIDSERQRAKLSELLGPALVDLAARMRDDAKEELSDDRARMQSELEELRSQKKDFASKRDAQKASLLSEQRQRRALNDRNRDLEAKIAELESEIEQHRLTISSLMNKLRVSEVNGDDVEEVKTAYEHRIEELKAALQAKEAENVELAAKIADLEAPKALEAALEQRKEIVEAGSSESQKSKKSRKPRKPRKTKPTDIKAKTAEELADMEMVNFLVAGSAPAAHTPPEPDSNFGYQPPKHAPEPNPEIQLTLF